MQELWDVVKANRVAIGGVITFIAGYLFNWGIQEFSSRRRFEEKIRVELWVRKYDEKQKGFDHVARLWIEFNSYIRKGDLAGLAGMDIFERIVWVQVYFNDVRLYPVVNGFGIALVNLVEAARRENQSAEPSFANLEDVIGAFDRAHGALWLAVDKSMKTLPTSISAPRFRVSRDLDFGD